MRLRHALTPVRLTGAAVFLILFPLLSGCRTAAYYAQAMRGQWEVYARQESCTKLIADPGTSPELKHRLQLAGDLCRFAETRLGLPANGHYQHYADLKRPYVVWNVRAAPHFSLASRTWWYPLVGSLSYRGFFSKSDADHLASRLADRGFDTSVEGVEAYSTLGWLHDPLLNTFLDHDEGTLAEILFHELAHQRVFAPGDTDFNEAFATAVGQEGARRWLRSRGTAGGLERYELSLRRNVEFVREIQRTRRELMALYGDVLTERGEIRPAGGSALGQGMAGEKQEIFDVLRDRLRQLRVEWGREDGLDEWISGEVNNATLNSVATYYDLVPAFDRMLAWEAGDLERFYVLVARLARLSMPERHRQLQAWLSEDVADSRSVDP